MRVHWALSRARATHILLRIWNVNSCCRESRIGWESGSITIISLSGSSLFSSSLYLSDPVTECVHSYHGSLCSFSPSDTFPVYSPAATDPFRSPPSLTTAQADEPEPLGSPCSRRPRGSISLFFTEHIHALHQQMAQHLGRGERPWDSCSGCQKSLTSSGKHSLIGNWSRKKKREYWYGPL